MNNEEILKAWEETYRPYGRTRDELADDLNMSLGQLKYALSQARTRLEGAQIDPPEDWGTNHVVLSSRTAPTLKALLEIYEIDLNEWEVVKVEANKWEMGRKSEKSDLVWEKGKQTGTTFDDGTIFTAPLFQIKAWLVRKNPVSVNPVVRPIVLKNSQARYVPSITLKKSKVENVLFLPDVHFGFSRNIRTGELTPFHDRLALSASLELARMLKPTRIVWLGDLFDLVDWTDNFVRSPNFWGVMQPALYEAAWWIHNFLTVTPNMHILEGNHELRMKTSLYNHLQSAFDLRQVNSLGVVSQSPSLSIPSLLSLQEIGVDWVDGYPNNRLWLNDYLVVEHGSVANSAPGGTARKIIEGKEYSVVFGHVHRHEVVSSKVQTRNGNRVIYAATPGCLCRLDGVIPGHKPEMNWNQGVMMVTHDDGPEVAFRHFPINSGRVRVDNQVIVGEDHSSQIEAVEGVGFF